MLVHGKLTLQVGPPPRTVVVGRLLSVCVCVSGKINEGFRRIGGSAPSHGTNLRCSIVVSFDGICDIELSNNPVPKSCHVGGMCLEHPRVDFLRVDLYLVGTVDPVTPGYPQCDVLMNDASVAPFIGQPKIIDVTKLVQIWNVAIV